MIGVGIIGAGHIGATHARAIAATPGLFLAAACRPDPSALAGFVAEHGGTPYLDHQALLEDERVRVVLVATPHHLHDGPAVDALAAGRHVMLEKPIAPNVAACDRIIDAASAAGMLLMPGHTMRFTRTCRAARALIASGAVGEARYVTASFVKTWMESNRREWHLRPETGGGMLLTAGIHALDRALFLAGRTATHVSAIVETAFHRQTADDAALLLLRLAAGGAAQVTSIGTRDGPSMNGTEIVCEDATLRLDFETGVMIGRRGEWTRLEDSAEPDWAFRAICRQWEEFGAAIRGEASLPVDATAGRHVIAVIEAAMGSAGTAVPVG